MGMDSMKPVPALLDKYDTRTRPVPSWVPAGFELSMGTHGFFNMFFFVQKIAFFQLPKNFNF